MDEAREVDPAVLLEGRDVRFHAEPEADDAEANEEVDTDLLMFSAEEKTLKR
jgi:hypothetical protein